MQPEKEVFDQQQFSQFQSHNAGRLFQGASLFYVPSKSLRLGVKFTLSSDRH